MSAAERSVVFDEEALDDLLDFIQPNRCLPDDIAGALREETDRMFRDQLRGESAHPDAIPRLKNILQTRYMNACIHAGSNVGIELAQSLGERHSQSLLNSFHSSGLLKDNQSSRFGQILNASKPCTIQHTVFLRTAMFDIASARRQLGMSLSEVTVGKLVTRKVQGILAEGSSFPPWHRVHCALTRSSEVPCNMSMARITLTLDACSLVENQVLPADVAAAIETRFPDTFCVPSPVAVGQVDVYFPMVSGLRSADQEAAFIDACATGIMRVRVSGILGSTEMHFRKTEDAFIGAEGEVYALLVDGSFRELLTHPIVDSSRTFCNDLWSILAVLGVEATRAYIIEELSHRVVSGVNLCHITLLADHMTVTGSIQSISRYSMRSVRGSIMGKASFEESMDHLFNAGVRNLSDSLEGASAAIICGRRTRAGTGFVDVSIDFDVIGENTNALL